MSATRRQSILMGAGIALSGFSNPITNALGDLIRKSIRSPNYSPGVSGWSINRDGSAEFRSITVPPGIGGNVTFSQGSAPTALNVGDLWIDTAHGNIIKRWNGAAWVAALFDGSQAITPGTITAALLIAGIVVSGIVDATTINTATLTAATINASIFNGTDYRVDANGVFFYKAAPASGKLVFSLTKDSFVGNDGHGNTVVGGATSYVDNGVSFDAVNFQGGGVNFFNAPTPGGAYTLEATVKSAGPVLQLVTQLNNGDITIGPAATGNVILGLNNASGHIESLADLWADTGCYALDPVSGGKEILHSVSVTPGYNVANGWLDSGTRAPLKYRQVSSPANDVEIVGSVKVPAGFGAGQAITNAFNAAYRPTNNQSFAACNLGPGVPNTFIRVNFSPGGILTFGGPAANAAVGDLIDIHCLVSLNA